MIEIKTDVLRVKNADGEWETIPALSPEIPVKGVQANGTDLTPDANGKVNIPTATVTTLGLVKSYGGSGVYVSSDGKLSIDPASESEINSKSSITKPIVPARINYSVKSALTSSNRITGLTSAEMDNACAVLGAVRDKGEWVLKGTLNTENKGTGVNVDLSGCSEMIVVGNAVATSGISIRANSLNLLYNAFTSTKKSRFSYFKTVNSGYVCLRTSYSESIDTTSFLNDTSVGYDNTSVKISDITSITIQNNQITNVTSCDIKIYAR